MRLKRLELFGFKSFADRTVFEFGDDTLTGVVGPNGCGKSNVVDSLRWVLGETRAKSMRGTEMADVIFKGSSSRPAMSVAEVTLHLDNASETIADRGPEVSITRRVYKSGEGEYLIDGERVRLKDLREMLFDTGMGSRGYSVLEQGKIDAVLSQNPLERRRIFEEAAGVSRYRQRKHETELRLKRVFQDTERLDDILGELRTRVRSLKIQAGKAERFVAARDEWVDERTRFFRHRLSAVVERLAVFGTSLDEAEGRVAALREEREVTEREVAECETERGTLAGVLEELTDELARLTGEGRALEERRTSLFSRAETLLAQASEEGERSESLETLLGDRETELDAQNASRTELDVQVQVARKAAEEKAETRRALERVYRETRTEVEGANEAVLAILHQRTEAQNTMRHLGEARQPLAERQARAEERLREASDVAQAVAAEEARAGGELEEAGTELEAGDGRRRALEGAAQVLEGRIEEVDTERAGLEVERVRLVSKVESLLDAEAELADLGEGARRVIESVGTGDGPCSASALKGLLADHLSTETEVARSLDAVLGDRARALVLEDLATAQQVADWLRGGKLGLTALTLPQGLAGSTADVTEIAPGDGRVLCRLLDRVASSDETTALVPLLCAGVYVARDLPAALELVRDYPALRFVTREGELVDAAGMIGGHRSLTQGAIGRRARAAELEQELVPLTTSIEKLEEELVRLRADRAELTIRRQNAATELDALRHGVAEAKSQLQTATARRRDLDAAREHSQRECNQVREELEHLEQDLTSAKERRLEAERKFEEENGRLTEVEATRRRLEEERERDAREEGQARVELTRIEEQLGSITRRIQDLERVVNENRGELQRAKRLNNEHGENARQSTREAEALTERTEAVGAQRTELDSKLQGLRETTAQGNLTIESSRKKADEVSRSLDGANEALSERRLEKQRLEMIGDEIRGRASEELELDQEQLLEGFEPEEELAEESALEALEAQVQEMKRGLERMGPVNMEALGELEEVAERHDFLETQRNDLAQAKRALDETLRTIDKESRRLFLETFEDVRANFRVIFRQLFGGGKADVVLADEDDVLDAGVNIIARPPGREMLSIELLSGGQRTMTALALLFAVFKSRPSPFCVLDEVDAALDDANIQRFLSMLEDFRDSTQYIVVTHNKGTMADCQTLYGITMETKGVSRHVSVELEDVDEFVPQAQGRIKERASAREQVQQEGERARIDQEAEREELAEAAEKRLQEAQAAADAAQVVEEEPVDAEASGEESVDAESGEPVVELMPQVGTAEDRPDEEVIREALAGAGGDATPEVDPAN